MNFWSMGSLFILEVITWWRVSTLPTHYQQRLQCTLLYNFEKNSIIWRSVDCLASKAKEWRYIFGRNFLSKMKMKACLLFSFLRLFITSFLYFKALCNALQPESKGNGREDPRPFIYVPIYWAMYSGRMGYLKPNFLGTMEK